MAGTARSVRRSGGRGMRRRRRRRKKRLEARANMQPENIFEAKNARAGKRARSLISLVYGVAFCLINTRS